MTEIESAFFPAAFAEFRALIGEEHWLGRASQVADEARGNVLLAEHLTGTNRIALALSALSHISSTNAWPAHLVRTVVDYETCALGSQFLSLHGSLDPKQALELVRRFHGAIRNPEDLRALQFEWLVATHCAKRGYAIRFVEQMREARFDLLVSRNGEDIAIECKAISFDRGSKIHRREAMDIFSVLKDEVGPLFRSLRADLLIRIQVPNRLPSRSSEREAFVRAVKAALLRGGSRRIESPTVALHDFDAVRAKFPFEEPSEARIRLFCEKKFDLPNVVTAVMIRRRRVVLITLESLKPDRLVPSIVEELKSARDQLPTNYAGVICVKLDAIDADELGQIGNELGPATALRIGTSRFMQSTSAAHIVCVSYFADEPSLNAVGENVTSRAGRRYYFPRTESSAYSTEVAAIFAD